MKKLILLLLLICVAACQTSKKNIQPTKEDIVDVKNDTVKISNDELEYDVIIIEPGFNSWLASIAKPKGYYSQSFLENKNNRYVTEWNSRVLQPNRFNRNLYEMQINYDTNIDYGYDVNYKMYNYFIYFQNTYKQNLLGGFVPIN